MNVKIVKKINDDVYEIEHDAFGYVMRDTVSLLGVENAIKTSTKKTMVDFWKEVKKSIKKFGGKQDESKTDHTE